ncbi:MAG: MgtC/SapB family protein [Pseudomonadota bacterium]
MINLEIAGQFAAAIGLGLLIGFERERRQDIEGFAGVRTFALVALLGATAAFAGVHTNLPWLIAVTLLVVAIVVIVAYQVTSASGDLGITTEIAVLLTFLIGVLCSLGQVGMAAAIAVTCVLLLALKDWLHGIAAKIESHDIGATLQFAIITLIVLPLVPNVNYGPEGLEVINPYKIWLMVVLIAGLNFAGYLLVKMVKREQGLAITGLLGGLVSSTVVTLGFSQRSRMEPAMSRVLALAILLAWSVMYFRVVAEVAIINISLAGTLSLGMLLMGSVSFCMCFVLWRSNQSAETAEVTVGNNPFELAEAIKFGALFAAVVFVASAAQVYFGQAGLYLAGALAGLTDVDAIALSMADLSLSDPQSHGDAARTIVIAVISNTLVKSGMVLWLGAPALRRIMLPISGILTLTGCIAAWLVG